MADQWVNMRFDIFTAILGSDVELQEGAVVRLGPGQTDEKLFREERTDKLFDTREMLANLLVRTDTRKQDLIKPEAAEEALESGISVIKPHLELSLAPGTVNLCLGNTGRDIKRIVFDVELTMRPRKSSQWERHPFSTSTLVRRG